MGKAEESCSTHLIDGDASFNVDGIQKFMKEVKLGECGLSYAVVSIMGPQSSGKVEQCYSTQLIDGGGSFNVDGIEKFVKDVKLGKCGVSYAVVSIMGPQSSGKSTLLNHLFGTNFREMDAEEGRSQTTIGIWLANCVGIEPCTLVMDLEGTDGRERGEDNTAFERQSALFALAVSDIVLINMWCQDIGRVQAANKPLLRTVFQVMTKLFSPRKTTLMFVLRDKTKTPLNKLESALREDIQKIWDSVSKPQSLKETPLSEFFNVEVVALSSFELQEKQFKEQVARLRQRFFNSIAPGGLAGDRRAVVPASGFSLSAQNIWKIIKENKDLDLPGLKVMVATIRCEEIANEKFSCFAANEDWRQLKETVQSGHIRGFGEKLSSLLGTCLSKYDAEAIYFDEGVRSAKRKQLETQLLQLQSRIKKDDCYYKIADEIRELAKGGSFGPSQRKGVALSPLGYLVQPAYKSTLGHLWSGTLDKFKEAFNKALNGREGFSAAACSRRQSFMTLFDEGCADAVIKLANWDTSKVRDKFRRDIDAHVASVRTAKLSELTSQYEAKLNEALSGPVKALLNEAGNETWLEIRKLLWCETESAVSELSGALSGFDMDKQTRDKMLESLKDYARGVVEDKAREQAEKVLFLMKDRFATLFTRHSNSKLRDRHWNEVIPEITKSARSASLKLLSVMAAIRLGDKADNIENTLFLALVDSTDGAVTSRSITSVDPLASSTWEEVLSSKTLITPVQCKSLWMQFEAETQHHVTQAIAQAKLNEALSGPVKALLNEAGNETWLKIRKLLWCEIESAVSELSGALSGFDMDKQTRDKMRESLKDYARGVVEDKAREQAEKVLFLMKDRFEALFSRDSSSMPRVWTSIEDIQEIAKSACSASLKLLSVLAAIRLDDDADADNIENILSLALVDSTSGDVDPLALSTWEKVLPSKTLITPKECKTHLTKFKAEAQRIIDEAIAQVKPPPDGPTFWEFLPGVLVTAAAIGIGILSRSR